MGSFFKHYGVALLVSLVLHGVVLLAMLNLWQDEAKPHELKRPNYVSASLVQLESKSKKLEEERKAKEKAKQKVIDLEKKRKEQERLKKAEAEKKRKAAEQKQREQEKKKAEAQRKKQEADRQAAEQKAAKEAAAKEAEQKRQQEQAAFERALAQEQQQLQEQAYATEAQSFMSVVQQRIQNNWSRPPSARNGMECELLIKLVPTGRVINVDIVRSSGDSLFDRSAVQAVKKAEQFPEIQKMKPEVFERYYRELQLIFRPQDLRQ